MAFALRSTSFTHQGELPGQHTCEGADSSPPLAWTGTPAGTRSLALIVDDPDAPDPRAPQRTWVHWVLYDLPADLRELAEGIAPSSLPDAARQGLNDWHQPGWRGPCPPVGRHRYVFKLYALDRQLGSLGPRAGKADLERAMRGHVLGQAELVGYYQKRRG